MITTSLLGLFSIITGVGDFGDPRLSFMGSSVIFSGDVSYLSSQTRLGKPGQGRSCEEEGRGHQLSDQDWMQWKEEAQRHLLSQDTQEPSLTYLLSPYIAFFYTGPKGSSYAQKRQRETKRRKHSALFHIS